MKKILFITALLVNASIASAQIYRNAATNKDYNHFVRTGGGSAVYINQGGNSQPILRLSSGTTDANKNVKFTVENNGSVALSGDIKFDSKYNKIIFPIANMNNGGSYGGGITGDDGQWSRLALYHGHSIGFQTGSNTKDFGKTRLYIDQYGRVGIGTTNPTAKLAVNGTIRAKEIKVEGGTWADYVFADDYVLKPLNEVEAFISKNNHLPDVPSAAVVEEEGIALGEMNKILLQKVEELTLYAIQKDKEVKGLNDRLEKIETLLNK